MKSSIKIKIKILLLLCGFKLILSYNESHKENPLIKEPTAQKTKQEVIHQSPPNVLSNSTHHLRPSPQNQTQKPIKQTTQSPHIAPILPQIDFLQSLSYPVIKSKKLLEITLFANERNSQKQEFLKPCIKSFIINFFAELGDKSFITIMLLYGVVNSYILFGTAVLSQFTVNFVSVVIGSNLKSAKMVVHFLFLIGMVTFSLLAISIVYDIVYSKEGESKQAILLDEYRNKVLSFKDKVTISAKVFFVIFMTEFGDKSQINTIILTIQFSPLPIFVGNSFAHLLAIGLSIVIGYCVAKSVNYKYIHMFSALLFSFFAIEMGYCWFTGKAID